jgi:hypothetical protein
VVVQAVRLLLLELLEEAAVDQHPLAILAQMAVMVRSGPRRDQVEEEAVGRQQAVPMVPVVVMGEVQLALVVTNSLGMALKVSA